MAGQRSNRLTGRSRLSRVVAGRWRGNSARLDHPDGGRYGMLRERGPWNAIAMSTVITSIYDFEASDIDGRSRRLEEVRGQVVLFGNGARRCGFTAQYA